MEAIEVQEFGGSDKLEVIDKEVPEPDRGEVRIDIEAAGINFADIMQRRGHYRGGPQPPYVPGLEAAGTIDAVGERVNREVGDEVVAVLNEGGYAEKTVADARSLFNVPEHMSFDEAAGFPIQFLTAHNVLHEWGGLQEDEKVLIHAAAGGVGSAAVQLASLAGGEVFATASTEKKLDLAEDLGADHTINYVENDFDEEIDRITDGEGVDMVLDGVGGDVFDRSLDALSHFGRIVVYGVASEDVPHPDASRLLFENKSVIGFHLGKAMVRKPMKVLGSVPELTNHLEEGELEVIVGKKFDLNDAKDAHDYIEDRQSIGKVVLEP